MPSTALKSSSLCATKRKNSLLRSKSPKLKKNCPSGSKDSTSLLAAADEVEGLPEANANAKLEEKEVEVEEEQDEGSFKLKSSASYRSHAIQPLGNLLLRDSSANIRDHGLGTLRVLSDELVLDVLSLMRGRCLGRLAVVSKSFHVFSTHESLWRRLVLEELKGDFLFAGSWKSTYAAAAKPNSTNSPLKEVISSGIQISNFYSDYLFQSWLCANLEMKSQWLQTDNIQRRRSISLEEFISSYEEPNKPVLLEGCLEDWPALRKWHRNSLIRLCDGVKFAAGPVEMSLEDYFLYSDRAREERPLYVFDPKFAEKVPQMGLDYEVPEYFREDLFSLLGKERPDYRWIIIGPAGSGSSFHVDPNSTSAWNAVIRGSKKWVMFPPEVVPPGVHPSPDGAEVVCPVSIIEWFMNFYNDCKKWRIRPVECVCKAGEIVFVPNGWWHLVINLEESIAITQNYVSRRNLSNVLDFLGSPNALELISGTKDKVNLYEKFRTAVELSYPGDVEQLRRLTDDKAMKQKKMNFWESVADTNTGGFKLSL